MGSIVIDNLRKVFSGPEGDIVAVDDVSIEINDGEFLVLVGPSGSGKSTLLRLLSGLETATEGRILIDGEDVTSDKPKNRDIAMVFQNYALYPHLTARDNISFGLQMQGELSEEEINNKVEHAANLMGIEDLLEKMPSELSGGQKQRVALGRAIVRNPAAFLMDEPLSNLDAKLRAQMRTEIQMLQTDLDVTTVYVTHDQTEAMTMGDRIAIMNYGEVQQIATPLEAYYQPANQFVAGFIGSPSMNFLDVTVNTENGQDILEHSGFTYALTDRLVEAVESGPEEIVMGIRPEDIEIAQEPTENTIEVEVTVTEPLGQEQLVYFTLGEETYTASIIANRLINERDTIHFHVPPERIHLFDRNSGETIVNCIPPNDAEQEAFSLQQVE